MRSTASFLSGECRIQVPYFAPINTNTYVCEQGARSLLMDVNGSSGSLLSILPGRARSALLSLPK